MLRLVKKFYKKLYSLVYKKRICN